MRVSFLEESFSVEDGVGKRGRMQRMGRREIRNGGEERKGTKSNTERRRAENQI